MGGACAMAGPSMPTTAKAAAKMNRINCTSTPYRSMLRPSIESQARSIDRNANLSIIH
jgi:hypothetical protein